MTVEVDRKLPVELGFVDAAGGRVSLAGLRGDGRGVALFFMRAGNCMVCVRHARALAGLGLAERGVRPVVVVPGSDAAAARVRRAVGERVTVVSSTGAHSAAGLDRTLFLQHSGVLLVDAAGVVRYRLTAALPTGSFDGPALSAAADWLGLGRAVS